GGIFLITFLFVFLGLLPFSVFVIQALKKALKEKYNEPLLFLLVFASVYIGFFAVSSTKLPNYTVPSYPPLAVLIGYYLINSKYSKSQTYSLLAFILITILLAVGTYFGLKNEPAVSDLAYTGLSFLFLTAVGILALIFVKNTKRMIFTLFTGSFIFNLLFFYVLFPPIDKKNPVMQSLKLINKNKVVYYKNFNPAFAFYIKTPIKKVKNIENLPVKTYIITRKKYLKELKHYKNLKILFIQKDLFEKKYTAVLKKQ
ncbi:glycosyl transferase, family 39, partial [Hydrogenivirga sp. 128-5-R1-1]